jgi:hypothetical protein
VPKNEEEHGKNSAREGANEHHILNAKPISPEFLAAAIRELTVKFCPSSAIPVPQSAWQPSHQFFPQSQAIQSIQQPQPIREILPPPPESSSRPQSSSGTSELQSIAIVRDYHANHRRVSYGIRDQEAKKQLLQVCKHHHQ